MLIDSFASIFINSIRPCISFHSFNYPFIYSFVLYFMYFLAHCRSYFIYSCNHSHFYSFLYSLFLIFTPWHIFYHIYSQVFYSFLWSFMHSVLYYFFLLPLNSHSHSFQFFRYLTYSFIPALILSFMSCVFWLFMYSIFVTLFANKITHAFIHQFIMSFLPSPVLLIFQCVNLNPFFFHSCWSFLLIWRNFKIRMIHVNRVADFRALQIYAYRAVSCSFIESKNTF